MRIGLGNYSYEDLSKLIHRKGETRKESAKVTCRRLIEFVVTKKYLNEEKIFSIICQQLDATSEEKPSIEAALLFNQARVSKKLQKKIENTLYNKIGQNLFSKGSSHSLIGNRSIPTRNSSASSSFLFKSNTNLSNLSFALSGNPSHLEANSPIMSAFLEESREFNLDLEFPSIEEIENNSENQQLNALCIKVYEEFIQLLKNELETSEGQPITNASTIFIKKSLFEQLLAIEHELLLALIEQSQKNSNASDLSCIKAVLKFAANPHWLTEQIIIKLKQTLKSAPMEYLSDHEGASIRRLLRSIAWYIEAEKGSGKMAQLPSRLTAREREIIQKLKAHSSTYAVRDWTTYEESLNLTLLFPEAKVGALRDYSRSLENELYQLYEKLF